MTARAQIRSADLRRAAAIAKREGVRVEIERDGVRIVVTPQDKAAVKKEVRL